MLHNEENVKEYRHLQYSFDQKQRRFDPTVHIGEQ